MEGQDYPVSRNPADSAHLKPGAETSSRPFPFYEQKTGVHNLLLPQFPLHSRHIDEMPLFRAFYVEKG